MKQTYCLRLLMYLAVFFPLSVFAQGTITGNVTEASTGNPLPGANVVVKGTTNGTTTDFDGNFSLDVDSFPIDLVISSVGFTTQEVNVTSSQSINVALQDGVALDEIVLVGSRAQGRTAIDSAVPVDVIDVSELTSAGPQVNLNQILNYAAPSFTSNTQTISDGTDHIDPASLRGLGPDQVLVLINGKRRHTSSLVNVNGTFGRGNVGTDLNAIPAAAIKRIEVLRDGAAAQYGSDAIAGVINIQLNENVNELTLNVTSGAHFSKNSNNQTGDIDGETVNVSANYGLPLGDNGGFINFTGDFDYREPFSRMKEWEGSIFNAYNSLEWVAFQSGGDLAGLQNNLSDVQFYAQGVTHFDLATKNAINNATSLAELQSLLDFDTTENELAVRGQSRTDYNMRVGQSGLRGGRFFANFSLPIDDNGTELYSFAGLGSRNGNSAGFYRLPNQSRAYTPLYINGFLPEINSKITDKSIAVGLKGKVGDWDVDLSNTWGKNRFLFEISNTANATLQSSSPLRFDAGGFSFAQNTSNLDFTNFYDDILSGLNVALGAEYRTETYEIEAGEEGSWELYDNDGLPTSTPVVSDFYGNLRPAGSQVFPGFRPTNELSRNRNSIAGYIDIEGDITDKWLVGVAGRFENYSDFGSTFNYKIATRYKITDNFNVRGAFNTGFRAPSLHQLNFNSTSTLFVNGLPNEVVTASNDSQLAKEFGIEQLDEEQSASFSFGFTAKIPDANLKLTVDSYFVAIEDRIGLTGQFSGPDTGSVIDQALADAGAERAAFFANSIDTETIGLDIVITHNANLNENMTLRSDLSATFSKTEQVDDVHYPSQIVEATNQQILDGERDPDNLLTFNFFDEASRLNLEEAVTRTQLNLSNTLSTNKFTVFLRNVYFGNVTNAENNSYDDDGTMVTLPNGNLGLEGATLTTFRQQGFDGKLITDLSVGYNVTDNLRLTAGANNILDVYPDRNIEANRSSGRFDWSRRSQQFGVGGRFLFARLSFNLK